MKTKNDDAEPDEFTYTRRAASLSLSLIRLADRNRLADRESYWNTISSDQAHQRHRLAVRLFSRLAD